MVREAVRVVQPDGSIKILFRETNKKPEEKVEQKDQPKTESKSKDDKKNPRNPEKQRYYNPLNPGFVDIFGKHLIGKDLIITLVNGEVIKARMSGYGVYEVLVEYDGKPVILFKAGILKVEVL